MSQYQQDADTNIADAVAAAGRGHAQHAELLLRAAQVQATLALTEGVHALREALK